MYGHYGGLPPQAMQQQQPPGSSSPNAPQHAQQQQQQQLPPQQPSVRTSSASMQQQQQQHSNQQQQSTAHLTPNPNTLSHTAASPLDYPHPKQQQQQQPTFSHPSQASHPSHAASHPSLHSNKSTHSMATADIAAYYNLINSSHAPSNAAHSSLPLTDMRGELNNSNSGSSGSRSINGGSSNQSVSHLNPLSLLLGGGQLPPSLLNQSSNGPSSSPGSGLPTPSSVGSGVSSSVTSRQVQQLHNAQALQAAQAMLTNSNLSGADGMDTSSLFQYPPMPSSAANHLPAQSKQYGSQPVSPSLMSPYMDQYARSLQNDRRAQQQQQPQSQHHQQQQHHHQQQQQQQQQQQHQQPPQQQQRNMGAYDNRSAVQQLSADRSLASMYNSTSNSGVSSPHTPHAPHMQLPLTQPHARLSSAASASASASASSAHSVPGSSPSPSNSSNATSSYGAHLSSLKHELSDLTRRLEQQSADYYSTQREMIEKLAVFSQLMSAVNGAGGGVVGGAASAMAGRQQQQRNAGLQAHQYLMQGVNALMGSGPAGASSGGGGSGSGGSTGSVSEPMSSPPASLYSPAGISRGSSAHSGMPNLHNTLAVAGGLSSLGAGLSNVSPAGLPNPSFFQQREPPSASTRLASELSAQHDEWPPQHTTHHTRRQCTILSVTPRPYHSVHAAPTAAAATASSNHVSCSHRHPARPQRQQAQERPAAQPPPPPHEQ